MISRSLKIRLRTYVKRAALWFVYRLPPQPRFVQGRWVWVSARAWFSVSTTTFYKRESHVRSWLAEQLRPGSVFFDVGAHHGWVSMWCLPLVGTGGAVYSFEPSPANVSILEWHRAVNRFSQWTIVPKAVAAEDTMETPIFLIDSGDSPMNSLTSGVPGMPLMEGLTVNKFSVPAITLDTFCRELGVKPDLVKIDVEGAELLALQGAEAMLREYGPTLILAAHPYWLPAGQSPGQISELLRAHGYRMFDKGGDPVQYLRSGEFLCLGPRA